MSNPDPEDDMLIQMHMGASSVDKEQDQRKRNRWGLEASDGNSSSSSSSNNNNNSCNININSNSNGNININSNSNISSSNSCNDISATGDSNEAANSSEQTSLEPDRKSRRSRWETQDVIVDPPPPDLSMTGGVTSQPAMMSPEQIQQALILKMQLQHINDKMLTVAIDAIRIGLDPNRDPSPPPRYDKNGARVNTREMRMRDSLSKEKVKIIEDLLKTDPTFKAPHDYVKPKPFRKMYIPVKEHLNANFVGLIIGPRGNNQRMMESQTNCKISIRGKGSFKEGSKGRIGKSQPDEDDELHVHIQGEDEENVARAAKMVEDIINTPYDSLEDIKQKQLRELALINGTLREDDFCIICGEKGHKQPECPLRLKSFKQAGVKCANCGDLSHPTRDCPLKEKEATNEVILDSEYDSFIAELEGRSALPKSSSSSALSMTFCQPVSSSGGQTVLMAPSLTSLGGSSSIRPPNAIAAEPPKITTIIAPSLVNVINPSAPLSSTATPLVPCNSSSSSSLSSEASVAAPVFKTQILMAPSLLNVGHNPAPVPIPAPRPQPSIIHAPSLVTMAATMPMNLMPSMPNAPMSYPPINYGYNNYPPLPQQMQGAFSLPYNSTYGYSASNLAPPPPPPPPYPPYNYNNNNSNNSAYQPPY